MIDSLHELNKTIHDVVQRMVEIAAARTTSGNRYVGHDDVADLISHEDYLQYAPMIQNELWAREEILDVEFVDGEMSLNVGLDWCPNYQWQEGDGEIFGMSFEEWEKNWQAKPVSKPLDLNRMAEIGQNAIAYVLETSDMSIEDLTESLGMSMSELDQLGIYESGEPERPVRTEFAYTVMDGSSHTFLDFDEIHDALKAFKALPDAPYHSLDVVIPDGWLYAGFHTLLERVNDNERLCGADLSKLPIRQFHEYFQDTPVEAAYKAANQYLKENNPILFYVYQGGDFSRSVPYTTFEEAYEEYRKSPSPDRSLAYKQFDDLRWGKGGVLLQPRSARSSEDRVIALTNDALKNPDVALAHAKAILSVYPNDEKAWSLRDKAEAELGIQDRIVDISKDLLVGKWRIHYVPPGGHYGSHNQLVNNESKGLVQFYDMSQDKKVFPNGQMTSGQYYAETLLDQDYYPQGLCLDASVSGWHVSRDEMRQVVGYLRECEGLAHRRPSLIDRIYEAESRQNQNPLHKSPGTPEPER